MKKREPISKIMTTALITVQRGKDDLRKVKEIFNKENIRHVPVMDGEVLVGIISKNDIMRLSFGNVFNGQGDSDEAVFDMLTIDQVMSHNPKGVTVDTPIREVAELLVKEKFHSLPVMDGVKLKGIATSTDVIAYLLEQY